MGFLKKETPEEKEEKQQNKNQDYSKQAEKDFLEFTSYITKLDPIKLLSQLTLTFAPESELVESRQDGEHHTLQN